MAARRDIPWLIHAGFLAAACLAHAVVLVPGGSALALVLGAEPSAVEERVLAFELVEPSERQRIVEVDHANDQRPEDARRLAARDSDVERETRVGVGRPGAPAPAGAATPGEKTSEATTGPVDANETATPEQPELIEAPDGRESGPAPEPEPAPGSGPEPAPEPATLATDWAKLGGSPGLLHDAFGTRGRPDRPPEVERGRDNLLDSHAHLFAPFFTRMRERLLDHWAPQAAIDEHDPHGLELGELTRTTVVLVEIDRSGALTRLWFERDSGVEYLDAEAVRALRAAGPYLNPPKRLFGDADAFSFSVAFVVEPDGSARVLQANEP